MAFQLAPHPTPAASDGLPAWPRRPPRDLGDRGRLLPRRVQLDARRIPRRRSVLRRVRVPHHLVADRGARAHGRHRTASVLAPPGPTAVAGVVRDVDRRRSMDCGVRNRTAAVRHASRFPAGPLLLRQLGADLRGSAVLRKLLAVAAPLEPCRRGAVVPLLAADLRVAHTRQQTHRRHRSIGPDRGGRGDVDHVAPRIPDRVDI